MSKSASDLRNQCAIVQPRLYDSAMVTLITLNTEPHGFKFDSCPGRSTVTSFGNGLDAQSLSEELEASESRIMAQPVTVVRLRVLLSPLWFPVSCCFAAHVTTFPSRKGHGGTVTLIFLSDNYSGGSHLPQWHLSSLLDACQWSPSPAVLVLFVPVARQAALSLVALVTGNPTSGNPAAPRLEPLRHFKIFFS
jgi:hypothetical protein